MAKNQTLKRLSPQEASSKDQIIAGSSPSSHMGMQRLHAPIPQLVLWVVALAATDHFPGVGVSHPGGGMLMGSPLAQSVLSLRGGNYTLYM